MFRRIKGNHKKVFIHIENIIIGSVETIREGFNED